MPSPGRRSRCQRRTRRRGCRPWPPWPARCVAPSRAACWASSSAVGRATPDVLPSASKLPVPGCPTPCRRSWRCHCRLLVGRAVPPSPWARLQHTRPHTLMSIICNDYVMSAANYPVYNDVGDLSNVYCYESDENCLCIHLVVSFARALQ